MKKSIYLLPLLTTLSLSTVSVAQADNWILCTCTPNGANFTTGCYQKCINTSQNETCDSVAHAGYPAKLLGMVLPIISCTPSPSASCPPLPNHSDVSDMCGKRYS